MRGSLCSFSGNFAARSQSLKNHSWWVVISYKNGIPCHACLGRPATHTTMRVLLLETVTAWRCGVRGSCVGPTSPQRIVKRLLPTGWDWVTLLSLVIKDSPKWSWLARRPRAGGSWAVAPDSGRPQPGRLLSHHSSHLRCSGSPTRMSARC